MTRFEKEEMQIKTLKAYEEGINDAWECAKRIVLNPNDEGGLTILDLFDIFGTMYPSCILSKHSALEAMGKIKAWEMDKEAKKGDES